MTILLLALTGGVTLSAFLKKNDFFHPGRTYILIYALLFTVYSLHLCRFQQPWSPTTYMIFWGAVISFLGAGSIVWFYTRKIIARSSEDFLKIPQALHDNERDIDWNWFFKVTVAIFLIFTGNYLYNFLQYGLIPMFSDDPNQDRFLYLSGNMFIAIAGSSGPLVMMLATEILLVNTTTRSQKTGALLMLIISCGLYFTLVTRMPIVRALIYMILLSHYFRKPISLKTVLVFTVLVSIFFLFGALVRVNVTEISDLALRLKINIPLKYIPFVNPYAYAVNNVWNMDYGFRKFIDGMDVYQPSMGFEFFRGILTFTKLEGFFQHTFGFDSLFNESIVKVRGLNTVIYIWHFYKDFGILGPFIVSFILGISIHIFYYNTVMRPTHLRIALSGLIISMIVFSFMIPLWSFWNLYYEALIITLAHRRARAPA